MATLEIKKVNSVRFALIMAWLFDMIFEIGTYLFLQTLTYLTPGMYYGWLLLTPIVMYVILFVICYISAVIYNQIASKFGGFSVEIGK